jgi:uncharacterized protein YjbJ (UPF0337 family)
MNDILEGNWKEIRGGLKEWWGDLTDDDLTQIEGKRDRLVGTLQKRYGYAKERAEKEVDDRLAQWEKAQAKNKPPAPKKL